MRRTVRRGLVVAVAGMATAIAYSATAALAAEPAGSPWVAVSEQDLAGERARGVEQNFELNAELNGGTTEVNDATMTNSVAGDAFAGSSGIINVIQNNGNQAIIQNGVVVNVNMYQGPGPE